MAPIQRFLRLIQLVVVAAVQITTLMEMLVDLAAVELELDQDLQLVAQETHHQ
jgi:hypothetical protein